MSQMKIESSMKKKIYYFILIFGVLNIISNFYKIILIDTIDKSLFINKSWFNVIIIIIKFYYKPYIAGLFIFIYSIIKLKELKKRV